MRIALAAEGTRGDVHPMLALAGRLAARDHDVWLCGPPDFAADASRRGIAFRAVGPEVRSFLDAQAGALHGGALAVARAGTRFFQENAARHFRELPHAAEGAEVLVAAGTQLAAASVAEALGARYHYVAYYPALFPTAEAPPAVLPFQRLPRWLNRAAWSLAARAMEHALRAPLAAGRASLGLSPARDFFDHVFGAAPLLAADPQLAPPPADTRWPVRAIGCLHPFEPEPLPPKLEDFLAAGEPPVYVGFGSMTDPAPAATTALVLEAVRRAGVRALLSEGWAGLGRAPLPEGVLAIGPVSHAALFRHVAAVVHHGGAGTTGTAARAGAPQVVVPHLLDQFWWAHRVASLGLGPPPLPRRRLTAERLAERLRALRDNEIVSERAAEQGAHLRAALAARDDPADAIA